MRFNPPPNWPPAPPGWAPEPGWQPDPTWGPPPPGWPLWVDDTAAGAPRPARARRWWILAAALVVVVALGAGLAWFVTGGRGGGRVPAKPSDKSDLTELSADLLVDKSVFPDLGADAEWKDWSDTGDDSEFGPPEEIVVTPPDCADVVDAPRSTTAGIGRKVSEFSTHHLRSFASQLSIGPEPVALGKLIGICGTFEIADAAEGGFQTLTATVTPLSVDGLPDWAVAYTLEVAEPDAATTMMLAIVAGYCRGILVDAIYADNVEAAGDDAATVGADVAEDLLTLFTAQVDKVEAAP